MTGRSPAGLLCVPALSVVVCFSIVPARQLTVAPGGGARFSRIQRAVDAAEYGDTICVGAGVYDEKLVLGSGLTLLGEGRENTRIEYHGTTEVITIKNARDVTVKGLHACHVAPQAMCWGGVIFIDSSRNIRVIDCRLVGCGVRGVHASGSCKILIEGNEIYGNEESGIYVTWGSDISIRRNVVRNNRGFGLWLDGPAGIRVERNTIVNNANTGLYFSASDDPSATAWIQENIVVGNEIGLSCGSRESYWDDLTLQANDIFGNRDEQWQMTREADSPTGSRREVHTIDTTCNFSVDPRFVASQAKDFRLSHDSPLTHAALDGSYVGALPPLDVPSLAEGGGVAVQPITASAAEPVPDLTADVDVNVPEAGTRNPRAVAVIVSGQDYQQAPNVDYAARDGAVLRQYLVKTLGFSEENIILLRNPGKADFERVFGIKGKPQGQLYNYVRKGESDVFVYYTGHGAPDLKTKEAYLVPTDAQPSYIDLQGYPLSTFYENLAQIPAKSITVVLDACFSGAYDKGLIVQQASPLVVAAAPEPGKLPENMTLLTSAAGDQVSSWYADKKHSLFTYWFLKGLQGAADANKDKSITTGEMKAYLSENVSYWAQRLHNRIQTPSFSGDENRVFAKLK